jgi:competence protein ComEA
VHVLGAVVRPGVVSLPAQSRVLDAINAAGGLRRRANPGDLNLAQVLADGEQVLIGTKAEPAGEVRQGGGPATRRGAGSTATRGGQAQLDLNAATEAELETLPGIGPVTAAKITAWRDEHGRFTRVEELQEIDGIGPKTFAQLADHVRV